MRCTISPAEQAVLLLLLSASFQPADGANKDSLDYSYSYSNDKTSPRERKGSRLIHAAEADTNEYPFVGAYFIMANITKSTTPPKCTLSLVSARHAVIASHCFPVPELNHTQCEGKAVSVKVTNGVHMMVYCKQFENGDVKIWQAGESVLWYAHFGSINAQRTDGYHVDGYTHHIEYFIRHKDSYDPEHRGQGGYDIGILKLKVPNHRDTPVCLPGPTFQDTKLRAKLAGYGKFIQPMCMTTSQGPQKYHFCLTDPDCDPKRKKCEPSFSTYNNKTANGCSKSYTPARYSRLCETFLTKSATAFRQSKDEIHLFYLPKDAENEKGKFLETCYRKEADNAGWCRTNGDYSDINNPINEREGTLRLSTDYGWGLCSESCGQTTTRQNEGILRKVDDADVLEEAVCDHIIDLNMNEKNTSGTDDEKIRPKALCIGRISPLKYQAYFTSDDPFGNATKWGVLDNSFFKQNPNVIREVYRRNKLDVNGTGYYITSVGSCHGDSGGPVFQTGNFSGTKRFVITGLVSGGAVDRNGAGTCGGINSPTLYVRLRGLLTDWILKHLGADQACLADQVYQYHQEMQKLKEYFEKNNININV